MSSNLTCDRKVVFLLGAGFSKAMAKLPVSDNFSEQLYPCLINKLKEMNIPENFVTWIKDFKSKGKWDFEIVADLLRHCTELSASGYPGMPTVKVIEGIQNIIKDSLFETYGKPIIDEVIKKDFLIFIEYLLARRSQIHIFDLNFDSVVELLFDINDRYNDFFSNKFNESLYVGVKTFSVSSVFDCNLNEQKINHYKLHGAFNLVSFNDDRSLSAEEKVKSGFGFRQISIDEKYKPEYCFITTGRLNKLAVKGYSYSYVNYCYESLGQLLNKKNDIFLVGYGGGDQDVNFDLKKALDVKFSHNQEIFTKGYIDPDFYDNRLVDLLDVVNKEDVKFEDFLLRFRKLNLQPSIS